MKPAIKLFTGILLLIAAGCKKDFLDKFPLDSVTNETFWQTEAQLSAATLVCYSSFSKDLINLGEGCAESAYWGQITGGLNKVSGGQHGNDGFPVSSWWNTSYANIFRCNNFLENYNRADIPQEVKDRYAAEVKVIRAFNYFILTGLYGDVPLVDKVLTAEDPVTYGPRTPKAQVVDWMLEDMDWAAEKLSGERPVGKDIGRINKWGALAVKARVALQNERWEVAADAAWQVMQSNQFSLYADYTALFTIASNITTNPANRESIICGLYAKDLRMHNLSGEVCKPIDYVRFNPGKTLVDAYLCTDGKPAVKGYEYRDNNTVELSPLYDRTEPTYANYWENRDPRMGLTILKPGAAWTGGNDGTPGSNTTPTPIFHLPRFAGLKANNRNGANSMTGFYFIKYCDPSVALQTNGDYNDIQVLRYAEILLIYAEAKFKQGQLTQVILDQTVNQLRTRVGMHHMILTELAAWGMDIETELRRERRIELAFEGMRLFDIYRWKEGERMGLPVTGPRASIVIQELGQNPYAANGLDANGDIIYEKSVNEGGGRNFDPAKHYLWPVPNGERIKNPNLGQNPNWDL
ncbi:RagB/SusD family nutrient uptake outer membrane protein [Chitinophaga sp. XS-30]|uniref:RagB/SusD family nutrient uptake outer membrane protein n=1 Tax=Chitinophaga sp. XS-30 TaxID=2604421 RepID=UPI0011DCFAD3|nr:RagB/SusD family nutrient uptake outer membrane protein [Chitinophaga sp. XS-30]QEH42086.1 RagB/SusD family nutrient uptake outer membrane protein [Chitinophaga sp. XS-30]